MKNENKGNPVPIIQALIGCFGTVTAAVIAAIVAFVEILGPRVSPSATASPATPTAAVAAAPTVLLSLPPTNRGCPPLSVFTLKPSGIIASVILAQGVTSDNKPVNPTTEFRPDSAVYAVVSTKNAPRNTKISGAWYTTDTGVPDTCNTEIWAYTQVVMGDTPLPIFWSHGGSPARPGDYRVEIYVNDNLEQVIPFHVVGPPNQTSAAQSTNTPRAACPPITPPAIQSSGMIKGVTLAEDRDPQTFEPINPTTVFGTNSVFHAVAEVQNPPTNTVFKVVWIIVDVGNPARCNIQFNSVTGTWTTQRNQYIDFWQGPPPGGWQPGQYRAEIYVSDNLDQWVTLSVR